MEITVWGLGFTDFGFSVCSVLYLEFPMMILGFTTKSGCYSCTANISRGAHRLVSNQCILDLHNIKKRSSYAW
ncbi:hypothetical protein PROFUN_16775 [Planoprotostelium fungivorum]|uniref:Uncharacterized protein n=1 Tax=Planoprotostelium fungivorum TaxID=1890364 RepID=A0A2P6MMZ0_9EUKA|nr:hypothetical protein PROFUN_16775 [Planoprotostelium fungivorum]